MMDFIKKIPLPIWIGLGMVLILIVVMANRQSANSQSNAVAGGGVTAAAGPVTTATVGTQGTQAGAGTDQQLGNLSQITQSGFSQIASQEQGNQILLSELAGGMSGVGTPMQQVGGAIQSSQNGSAANNATNGTTGQNAGTSPSPVTTHS